MRLMCFSFLLLILNQAAYAADEENLCVPGVESVQWVLCIEDSVKEVDQLKTRIQDRIYKKIDLKYGAKNPARAKVLKWKTKNSSDIWEKYRLSYCDMESIHIEEEENRGEFIKECLLSITNTRIEELRLLQLNI